jgi:hypothetical protein
MTTGSAIDRFQATYLFISDVGSTTPGAFRQI